MTASSSVYRELVKELGEDKVSNSELELLCYSYDSSPITGKPDVVVWPESYEEVMRVIEIAKRENVALVPRGSGTSIEGGPIPSRGGIVLHTARLRNFTVKPEEGLVRADAGCLVEDVAQSSGDMFFPLATVYTMPKTIGGVIAEDYSCIQGLGGVRSNVETLRIATPKRGIIEVTRDSRPSIEDIVGSKGVLGVILEASLKLHRRVDGGLGVQAEYGTVEEACRAAGMLSSIGGTVNVEIIDQKALSFDYRLKGWPEPLGQAIILAEFRGEVMGRVGEILGKVPPIQFQFYEDEPWKVWNLRNSLLSSICRQNKSIVRCRVRIDRSMLPEFFRSVERISGAYRLDIGIYGNALSCEFYPTIASGKEPGETERAIRAREKIIDLAIEMNGLQGDVRKPSWKTWMALGYSRDDIGRIVELKRSLDPTGIMNPGKV